MSVDHSRREVSAGNVDDLFRVVIAEADHATVVHGHVGFVNLAAQNIDEARILEEQLRRRFTARDTELVLNVAHWELSEGSPCHDKTRSAIGCSGVASGGLEARRPWIAL